MSEAPDNELSIWQELHDRVEISYEHYRQGLAGDNSLFYEDILVQNTENLKRAVTRDDGTSVSKLFPELVPPQVSTGIPMTASILSFDTTPSPVDLTPESSTTVGATVPAFSEYRRRLESDALSRSRSSPTRGSGSQHLVTAPQYPQLPSRNARNGKRTRPSRFSSDQ